MSLPYSSATSGKGALEEAKRILEKFGAGSFGYMEDFDDGTLAVQFKYRERRVTITASAKGYAAAYLRDRPHTRQMRMTKQQHEQRALKQGQIAVCSILRDWIKGQITAVECGMLSFEGAFLGQILLDDGSTVYERVTRDDILALPPS